MLMKNNIVALWILGSIASPTTMARNLRGGETTSRDGPPSWGPDDRKLDYSYSYYWTKTGTNQFYRGNFNQDIPEGWVRQEEPPTEDGWIQGYYNNNDEPAGWVSWVNSASSSSDSASRDGPPSRGPDDRKLA